MRATFARFHRLKMGRWIRHSPRPCGCPVPPGPSPGSARLGNMSPSTVRSTRSSPALFSQEPYPQPLKGVGKSFLGCDSYDRAGWNSLRSANIAKLLALWGLWWGRRVVMTSHWLSLGLAVLALGQSGSSAMVQPAPASGAPQIGPVARPPQPVRPPQAPTYLARRVDELGSGFNGRVGIAVQSVDEGWVTSWNGNELTPQQSVSKLWVAITALDAVDKGRVRLDDTVTLTRSDLTLFHQPIAQKILGGGTMVSLGELMYQALTKSDNTC